ncbi:hypothetical protein [Novosphingobium sp. M1R2S20]|uniref:Lipoprotein n=1 Tax=Novosphingobium rhizovicinum TaxID=3228928 RepID=A0ABV3RCH0_9SPHN
MRVLCLSPLLLSLCACGGQKTAAPEEGSSFGEVLPGSVSDAMLPYDTASSAPPLETPQAASPSSAAGKDKAGSTGPANTARPAETPEDQPQPEPEPDPT